VVWGSGVGGVRGGGVGAVLVCSGGGGRGGSCVWCGRCCGGVVWGMLCAVEGCGRRAVVGQRQGSRSIQQGRRHPEHVRRGAQRACVYAQVEVTTSMFQAAYDGNGGEEGKRNGSA